MFCAELLRVTTSGNVGLVLVSVNMYNFNHVEIILYLVSVWLFILINGVV